MGSRRLNPPTGSRPSIRALCTGVVILAIVLIPVMYSPYQLSRKIVSSEKTTREEASRGAVFFSGCFCLFIVSNLKLSGKYLFFGKSRFCYYL